MKTTIKKLLTKFFILLITTCLSVSLLTARRALAQDEYQMMSDAQMVAPAAFAQLQKLTTNDGAASDAFGYKVALSGNTAVIGSPLADVNGKADQGVVYVCVYNNGVWTAQAKLLAPDGNANSQFGYAVAFDGDTVVVGARGTDPSNKGAAYVFVRSGASWAPQAKLTSADGGSGDRFGESVGISGNTLIIGAPLHDNFAPFDRNKGGAYIFTRSGVTWTEQAKLTASNPQDFDFFGSKVAVEGDTAIIGAPQSNGDVRIGSAYVFTRNGTNWSQQAKLAADDGAKGNNFGVSLSLSGDTAVVGASSSTVNGTAFQGATYVFTRTGANWSQQAKLTASDGANSWFFGFSALLKNDTLAVGAPGALMNGKLSQGAVYLFSRTGNSWSQQTKLLAPDGNANDQFGSSIALDGSFLIAGTPQKTVNLFNDVDTQQHGAIYIFSSLVNNDIPKIESVKVKGKKLLVTGTNFEAPSFVYLNGEKQKKSVNDEASPTTLVVGLKAGKLLAPGQTVSVQIKNETSGKISEEFIFTRPLE